MAAAALVGGPPVARIPAGGTGREQETVCDNIVRHNRPSDGPMAKGKWTSAGEAVVAVVIVLMLTGAGCGSSSGEDVATSTRGDALRLTVHALGGGVTWTGECDGDVRVTPADGRGRRWRSRCRRCRGRRGRIACRLHDRHGDGCRTAVAGHRLTVAGGALDAVVGCGRVQPRRGGVRSACYGAITVAPTIGAGVTGLDERAWLSSTFTARRVDHSRRLPASRRRAWTTCWWVRSTRSRLRLRVAGGWSGQPATGPTTQYRSSATWSISSAKWRPLGPGPSSTCTSPIRVVMETTYKMRAEPGGLT